MKNHLQISSRLRMLHFVPVLKNNDLLSETFPRVTDVLVD